MDQSDIKSSLIELGYSLKDCGSHWRTNALYRGGTNPTALMIYKDTGVWSDFVRNTPSLPFKDLVCATLKTNDKAEVEKFLSTKGYSKTTPKHQPKISSEKIYPTDVLDKLLPHYIFYKKKGVKEQCLIDLHSGLATEGSMYQRFVFPIFNEHSQIHGFSGRDMLDADNRPKWKLVGKKNQWIYPMFVKKNNEFPFLNYTKESGSVILVESIGDMLALHSCGIYNCVVLFGTAISSKLLCFLMSLGLNRIYISLNNDSHKQRDSGRIGSIKTFIKCLNYFDSSKLIIAPPTLNDFGDMDCDQIDSWINDISNTDTCEESISKEIKELNESGEITQSTYKSFLKNSS